MNQTTFQPAEIYDSNGNLIQQGAYGINTPFCTSTGDGVYDYIVNNLNALKDMIAAGYIAVATLPSSGQTNKYYVITEGANAGKCYVWTGTAWQELTTQINGKSAYEIAVEHGFIGTEQQWLDSFTADAIAAADRAEAAMETIETGLETLEGIDARFANVEDHAEMTDSNVDATKKRISNVEKLLQGNLYDYQTDETVAYEKTVPVGAMPYAGIERIGGKTLVWNQLIYDGNFTDANNWSVVNKSVADNVLSFYNDTNTYIGVNVISSHNVNMVAGHKYLICFDAKSSSGKGFIIPSGATAYGYATWSNATDWTRISTIFSPSTSESVYMGLRFSVTTAGTTETLTGSIKNYQCFDLTLMFGSGNEPTTIEQFREMFPAEYYPYNAGTLLSAGVTEVESVGRNLCDVGDRQNVSSQTVLGTVNLSNGTYTISATVTNNTSVSGYLSLRLGSTAKTTITIANGDSNVRKTATVTLTESATYTIVGSGASAGYSFNVTKIQIEKGTTATDYSPYKSISYPIPTEIQALEGYGWSAGSVYNYIDFERKVYVQNVARVDLGTATWSKSGTSPYPFFVSTLPIKPRTANNTPNNILTSKYVTSADNIFYIASMSDMSIMQNSTTVYFYDSANGSKTATEYKALMDGVYLYYELATPIETDISAYLSDDNLIKVESGGTLTMYSDANGDDDAYHIPVPSTVEYMIDLNVATGGTENEP